MLDKEKLNELNSSDFAPKFNKKHSRKRSLFSIIKHNYVQVGLIVCVIVISIVVHICLWNMQHRLQNEQTQLQFEENERMVKYNKLHNEKKDKEREKNLILEEMKLLEQDTQKITEDISNLQSKQDQLNQAIQQIKEEINRYNNQNNNLMGQLYRNIA